MLDDREVYELRTICMMGGLLQDSLAALIDASLSVPTLVRSEAAAMVSAKKAAAPIHAAHALISSAFCHMFPSHNSLAR